MKKTFASALALLASVFLQALPAALPAQTIYWGDSVPKGWNGSWPAKFLTVPEKTNYTRTASSTEVLEFLDTMRWASDKVAVINMFVTSLRRVGAAVVLASPTVLNALHPLAQFATLAIKTSKPPFKYGVIMNSYGWGKGAVKQGLEFFAEMGIELVDTVEVKGTPAADDFSRIGDIAGQLAAKVLADGR